MNEQLIWVLVGLVPYYTHWERHWGGRWTLDVQALFLSMHVCGGPSSPGRWTLQVPLIERFKDAIWAAVLRLKG